MYKTYEEWQAAGYQVVKGSKAAKKDEQGRHLFSEFQVLSKAELNEILPDDIYNG